MTALEAAHAILAEAGQPLHYREITKRMLDRGLWTTTGRTPEGSVASQLGVNARGPSPSFRALGGGLFTLAEPPAHATAPTPASKVSFTTAAERILEEYGQGRPMHYADITAKALELGLIATAGRTPEVSMYAQILSEIRRQTERGEPPRFARCGRGLVGLSRWQPTGPALEVVRHNDRVRRELRQALQEMPPREFEGLVGQLLAGMGFDEVEVTAYSGDGGVDVRAVLVVADVIRSDMAVQVKRYRQNIQASTVRELRGALAANEGALIITTSGFSSGARREARRAGAAPVALMDGTQLVALLMQHGIGVRKTPLELFELGGAELE